MFEIKHLAVAMAAIMAFVIGAVWNSSLLFSDSLVQMTGIVPAADAGLPVGRMFAELLRVSIVALVLAWVLRIAGIEGVLSSMGFAVLIFIGFQAALVAGGVIWENMPVKLYAIHMGDSLVKMLAMAAIFGFWR